MYNKWILLAFTITAIVDQQLLGNDKVFGQDISVLDGAQKLKI